MKALAEESGLEIARASGEVADEKTTATQTGGVSRFLSRLIFISLLAVIVLCAIPYGANENWWIALFECAVFALGALWAIEGALSGSWLAKGRRLLLPLLAIALYAFIQTISWGGLVKGPAGVGQVWSAISADPYGTRLFVLRLLALIITLALLLRYTSSRRRLRALIFVVMSVAIASALFGLFRQAVPNNSIISFLPRLKPDIGYAQFINRNHFAFLMEMALGLTLGLAVGALRGGRRERLLIYLAAALPLWITLVLSTSRGGIFTMFAELIFLALLVPAARLLSGRGADKSEQSSVERETRLSRYGGSLMARIALIICLAVGAGVSVVWIGGDPLLTRLETVPGEFVSAEGGENVNRLEIWRATWQLIKQHPIVGSGFGAYWVAITEHHRGAGRVMPWEAHNDYLELMSSGGLIGVLLAAWFVIMFIKRARLSLRSHDRFRRAAALGALVGLLSVSLHSLVDFGLHITINALVCVALIVIAVADERVEAQGDIRGGKMVV